MQTEFWNQRWARGQIAFHEGEPNARLRAHFKELALSAGDRVFVPLCGKTRDIAWLLSRDQRVVGVELVESAVEQLFRELSLKPRVSRAGRLKLYQAENLNIFAGDVFDLSREICGPVDAIYDRAALVALPDELRRSYARKIVDITKRAPQLLITYEYNQERMAGPPFAIDGDMLAEYYSRAYEIQLAESCDVPGGLKGLTAVKEKLWLLKPLPE